MFISQFTWYTDLDIQSMPVYQGFYAHTMVFPLVESSVIHTKMPGAMLQQGQTQPPSWYLFSLMNAI